MMLYRDLWVYIAGYLDAWKPFTQVCKAFNDLALELEDSKYDKVKSILNLLPSLNWLEQLGNTVIDPLTPGFKTISDRFVNPLDTLDTWDEFCKGETFFVKEIKRKIKTKQWGGIIDYLYYLIPLFMGGTSRDSFIYVLGEMLGQRSDIKVEYLPWFKGVTQEISHPFWINACTNPSLPLKELIPVINGLAPEYLRYCSTHPDITQDLIETFPDIDWDWLAISKVIPLKDGVIPWLISKSDGYGVLSGVLSNPSVTFDLIKGYKSIMEGLCLDALLASKCLKYLDIKVLKGTLISKGHHINCWELGVLLNPNITLRQTVELITW